MNEFRTSEAFLFERIPFERRTGSLALSMTAYVPITAESTGRAELLVPGLAAMEGVYRGMAEEGARRGNIMVTMGYSGCIEKAKEAVKYALCSLEDGHFGSQAVPVADTDEIIVYGHSLGPNKAIGAIEMMKEKGTTRVNKMVLGAAACLGGVDRRYAPFHAMKSAVQELSYIHMRAFEYHNVARDATRAILSLRHRLPHEIDVAMHDSIESRIADLQMDGMQFAAVDHNDDVLVVPELNAAAYERLNITPIAVRTERRFVRHAGHVVPLYHPVETFDALEESIAGMGRVFQKAS